MLFQYKIYKNTLSLTWHFHISLYQAIYDEELLERGINIRYGKKRKSP